MITIKYYLFDDEDIKKIKVFLKRNNLIQSDLAKQMNISLSYFNACLQKRRRLNQEQFNILRNITNIRFKLDFYIKRGDYK